MVPHEMLALKWNNHPSIFLGILSELLAKAAYCDATVACQGKLYPVHRFVLSACSEYFRDIFASLGEKHAVIVLKDITVEIFNDLLKYMYQGEIIIEQEKLAKLISAAECLKIKGLAESQQEDTGSDDIFSIDVVSSSTRGRRNLGPGSKSKEYSGDKRKFIRSSETSDGVPFKKKRKDPPPAAASSKGVDYMSDGSSGTPEILSYSVNRSVKGEHLRGVATTSSSARVSLGVKTKPMTSSVKSNPTSTRHMKYTEEPSGSECQENLTAYSGIVKPETDEVFVLEDTSTSCHYEDADASSYPPYAEENCSSRDRSPRLQGPSSDRSQVPRGTVDVEMSDDVTGVATFSKKEADFKTCGEEETRDQPTGNLDQSPKQTENPKIVERPSETTGVPTEVGDEKRHGSCASTSDKPASASNAKVSYTGERRPKTRDCLACDTKNSSKHRIIHGCYSSRGEAHKVSSSPKGLSLKDGGASDATLSSESPAVKGSISPKNKHKDLVMSKLETSEITAGSDELFGEGSILSGCEAMTQPVKEDNKGDTKDRKPCSSVLGQKEKPIVLKRDNFAAYTLIKMEPLELKSSMTPRKTDEDSKQKANKLEPVFSERAEQEQVSATGNKPLAADHASPVGDGYALRDEGKPSGEDTKQSSGKGKSVSDDGNSSSDECNSSNYHYSSSDDDNFSNGGGKDSNSTSKPSSWDSNSSIWKPKSSSGGAKLLGNEAKSLGNEAKSLGNEAKSLDNEAKSLGNETKSLDNETKSLDNETKSLGNETKSLGNDAKSLGNDAKSLGNVAKLLGTEAKSLGTEAKSSGGEAKSLGNVAKSLSNEAKSLGNVAKSSSSRGKPSTSEGKPTSSDSKSSKSDCKASGSKVKSSRSESEPKRTPGTNLDPKSLPEIELDCKLIDPSTERQLEKFARGPLKSKVDNYGNWKCPICYHKTRDNAKYERHLQEHLRRKTYCCRHCTYRTIILQSFVVHLRKHSGVRPYKCLFCDYSTTQQSNLNAHVRKHYNT